jgi:hypothetical protein
MARQPECQHVITSEAAADKLQRPGNTQLRRTRAIATSGSNPLGWVTRYPEVRPAIAVAPIQKVATRAGSRLPGFHRTVEVLDGRSGRTPISANPVGPTGETPSDNQVTTSRFRGAFLSLLAIPGERVCTHLDPAGLD